MKDRIVESFSRAAALYHAHAEVQAAMAEWLGEWVPRNREKRALEIGAGPGTFTRQLLPWHGRLVVSDLSAPMCAAGQAILPQLEWRVMSAENPDRGPWDWIFCSSMLQWAENPAKIFSAWRKRLAPGGRVLAGLFVEGSLPEWREAAGDSSPVRWRTLEEWHAALEIAGLRLVREAVQSRTFRHPSARAFLRNLHGIGAAPERKLSATALRRILDRYEARFGGPAGVRATWTFYRFEAEL